MGFWELYKKKSLFLDNVNHNNIANMADDEDDEL